MREWWIDEVRRQEPTGGCFGRGRFTATQTNKLLKFPTIFGEFCAFSWELKRSSNIRDKQAWPQRGDESLPSPWHLKGHVFLFCWNVKSELSKWHKTEINFKISTFSKLKIQISLLNFWALLIFNFEMFRHIPRIFLSNAAFFSVANSARTRL